MILIIKKFFILIFLFFTFIYSNAAIARGQFFVGINALHTNLQFKEDFGGNVIPNKHTQSLNFLLGYMFNNYFGMEGGYEVAEKKGRIETLRHPSKLFNLSIGAPHFNPANDYLSLNTSLKQSYLNAGLIAKTKILNSNTYIGLVLGISECRLRIKAVTFEDEIGPLYEVNTFFKKKFVNFFKINIEQKFNNLFSLNIFSSFKNTSKITIQSKEVPPATIKLRNNFNFGAGATVYF